MWFEWFDWMRTHEMALWWLAAASILTFVATLVVVPWLIVRIPEDYFADRNRHRTQWANQHPVVRGLLLLGKNILGFVVVCVGLALLALPGQGILTIVIGIMLLDFPGKYRLERWVVDRRPVLRSINWLRRRAKRGPLVLDEHD